MEKKRFIQRVRSAFVLVVSIVFAVGILRITSAGDIDSTASPAGTLKTLEELYDPLVGSSYNSSAVTASSSGDTLELAKCIITKIGGGSCP